MKKSLLILGVFSLSLFYTSLYAQDRIITGQVTATENDKPIPGVNVLLKGTTIGTVTDAEGEYSLSVPDQEGTIVFSFIGYLTQEVPIGNRSIINISMETDVKQLGEVVVTAIGIERQAKSLGYAVTNLDADDVQQKAEGDIIRTLTAKVPGVNIQGSSGAPGASTNIVIRGYSSILGNNQPLFVVDGIPFDNSSFVTQNELISGAPYSSRALDLDPNDIQSVSVLKGAAASALYGSRAANGVVLITTKSGRGLRDARKGLEVTFKSSYTIEEVAGIPEFQNRFGQGGTTGGGSGIFSNAFFGSWGPGLNDIDSVTDWMGNRVPFTTEPDNVKDFFETGYNLENSLSIEGGTDNSTFSLTASHLEIDGFIPNSELGRTNIKLGGNTRLSNGLTAGGSLSYINTTQQGPPTGGGGVVRSGFSTQLWYLPRSYDPYKYPYIDPVTNRDQHYRSGEDHPLFSAFENPFTADVNRIFATANLGYNLADWLNVSYKIGFDAYSQNNMQVFAPSSQFAETGNITTDNITYRAIESNLLLTASKQFNEDLGLKVILGHNISEQQGTRQLISGTGIIAFGIDDITNTTNVVTQQPLTGYPQYKSRLVGVFGDAQLSFRDYLFLGLTARNDWSSTLPNGDRGYFYPAATLGFVFTEGLNIESNLFNYGKVRAAIGRVGNDAPLYSTQQILYQVGNFGTVLGGLEFPFNGTPGLTTQVTLGNPELTPEFTTEYEFGAELEFFDSRLGLDVTYFNRTTTDQIFSVSRAPSSGFFAEILNAGEVNNQGWEVGLNLTPISVPNGFRWNMYGTFTHVRNEVVSLIEGVERIGVPRNGANFSTLGTFAVAGEPFGLIQGDAVAVDSLGNRLIDPTTGYWINDPDNTRILGDPNPDFILGLNNTFSYKGISLNVLFDWKQGGDLYSQTLASMRGRGVLASTAEGNVRQQSFVLPGVLGDVNNPGTPLLSEDGELMPNNIHIDANDYFWRTSTNAPAEFAIFDATVVRLREVSLSYQLPENLLSDIFLGSASISFIGRNLWFNAPNMPDGYDPETNGRGAGNGQGMEFAYVPNARRYGVSLQLTF